jgi:SNF2 family DNA or RNA helicase
VDDLLSLFRFIRPGLLHLGMTRFEMHELMQPHFLRRRKSEVLQSLPPIITQDLPLELTGRQREAYNDVWLNHRRFLIGSENVSETHLFALITKLKQLCNYDPVSQESSKLEALKLIIEGLTLDDKLLIFSQYVETLQWLFAKIRHLVPCEVFHGGLSQMDRDDVLSRFRQSSGPRVLLVSLRAGAVGLNLQEATLVLLFDRWWNPALDQSANPSRAKPSVFHRVKARCQVEAGLGLLTSRQCSNHSVPGSSRYGSHPPSPKRASPKSLTRTVPR